jgi:hypothetical protein
MPDEPVLFTPDVCARIARQSESLPEQFRSTQWLHATHPELDRLRSWLDGELRRLEPRTVKSFLSRLRDEERYTQALAEIATGYVLRQPGYTVEFEPDLAGLTPDLLITDPTGRRLIVDVWRRGLPRAVATRNKHWGLLARQIQRIPVPLAIAVGTTSHDLVEPPSVEMRRRLGPILRRWLKAGPEATIETLRYERFVFRIVGTTTTGNAEMLPVRDGATADRKDVVEAIERKVRRYRATAVEQDIPFVVVLSSDVDTAMDVRHVENILEGKNSVSMQLPAFAVGGIDSGPVEMRMSEAPPQFDPALSGVGWLEINDGAHARVDLIWTNPKARWPVEPLGPPADGDTTAD